MKVTYIPKDTEIITKGMVDRDSDVVVIPNSVKVIEDGACILYDHSPMSFFYNGNLNDWKKVKVGEKNSICYINFLCGGHVEKL